MKGNNYMTKTRIATIELEVPTYKDSEKSINGKRRITIPFDVKVWTKRLEDYIKQYMTSSKKIDKQDKTTRWEEAQFILDELKKFYLLDTAGVKTSPEEEK